MHFDHCDNNALFSNAKFYVQAKELRYAYAPDRFQKAAYLRKFFDAGLDYVTVRGKHQINDDVILVPTPGHSIGHQSVLIRGERTACIVVTPRLFERVWRKKIPGVMYRADQASESIDKLRSVKNAAYIYSHDKENQT